MLDKKKFYINGEWISPKKPNDFKVIDPSTEEDCAVISLGGVEDVNDAVICMGRLATLLTIMQSKETSRIKIELRKKQLVKRLRT